MRKFIFLILVVGLVCGCTRKVVHITPSGQVEITVVRPFTPEISGMLQSRMEERGYELFAVKGDDLIFRRLTKEGMVAFLDGVGVDMPEARIIYHIAKKEHSFNVTALFALVKDPGQYNESIKYVNDHGDTVKYQKMLNDFKADVESLPVVAKTETNLDDDSGSAFKDYAAYFRDEEEAREQRLQNLKKREEKAFYEMIKTLPATNYKANLKGYKELLARDPSNKLYREKMEYYSAKVKEEFCKTSGECTDFYAKVKKLPASDYEGNLNGYRELLSQYPKNKKFQRKVEFYSQKIADDKLRATCDLEVTSWGWHYSSSGSYMIAEGEVENLTGRRLERVKFVVSYYDENDNFVTSGKGYLEYKTLMPGQRSPFKGYSSYNPAAKSARLELVDDRGKKINTFFRRK